MVLPLLAALLEILGSKWRLFRGASTGLLASTMLLSWWLLVLSHYGLTWHWSFTWLPLPSSALSPSLLLGIVVDFPVAVMVGLTTTISWGVHLYAMAYLEAGRRRYGVLIGGFVSVMLGFWMADNLLGCFMGWELIGWASYGLIGFWYQEEEAAGSSTQAWLINQLGSVILLVGILLVGSELGTWNLAELAALPPSAYEHCDWLGVARFCLIAGASAKSAQWPWFSWLSSAMTAPTPASALIHSATLVGAGVYLLMGLAPVLGEAGLAGVAYVGAVTALMGACAALTQVHGKQVLAYSTISQLGYALMAVGAGASGVGMLHFITHAFAKACLFLALGVVTQFVGTGNMHQLGGLRKRLPVAFGVYLVAAFSLLGVPGFAGALSKEAVLACTWAWAQEQAQVGHYWGYAVPGSAWLASLLAVVYMGRQGYLVFMGAPRWEVEALARRAGRFSWGMRGGMVLLALGTLGYWYGPLVGDGQDSWLLQRLGTGGLALTAGLQHGVLLATYLALGLGLCLWIGWQAGVFSPWLAAWRELSLQGWYLEALGHAVARIVLGLSSIVARFERRVVYGLVQGVSRGYVVLGYVVHWLDRQVLQGLVLLVAAVPRYLSRGYYLTEQGHWQGTLWWMLIGLGLLGWGIYWAV